jgi:hypothetical protein
MRNGTKILIGFIIANQLVIYALVLFGLFTQKDNPTFWPHMPAVIGALAGFSAMAFGANEWRKAKENTAVKPKE